MRNILLLGAGFSRNWGCWLANEVFEYLLGTPEVTADDGLRQHLWKHRLGGFEDAINELQVEILRSAASGPVGTSQEGVSYFNNNLPLRDHLGKLESAVARMFDDTNNAIKRQFELNQGGDVVGPFLTQFDAIFTLNQDLLLERLYARTLEEVGQGRWKGVCLPGMREGARDPASREMLRFMSDYRWHPRPEDEFRIEPDRQPIYKLHGSTNWFTETDRPMMIVGGNKTRRIAEFAVLRWYAAEFARQLSEGARLMIIGYGFRDKHINDAMARAAEHGLRVFVIDPNGRDVAKFAGESDPSLTLQVQELFERTLIGASRRSIPETLRERGAERSKLDRFFAT